MTLLKPEAIKAPKTARSVREETQLINIYPNMLGSYFYILISLRTLGKGWSTFISQSGEEEASSGLEAVW